MSNTDARPKEPMAWLHRPAGSAFVVAFFLLVATIFSWPAATLNPAVLVTRHFDLYVSVWLMEQAVDGFPKLIAAGSGWPDGESLQRADSILMLALAWASRGVLSGWLTATLYTWLVPFLNALAAEHCARRVLAVRRPWSLLAGLSFGFSGIAASAVLEGHVYLLMACWLPLMITTAWTGPDHGLPWGRGALLGLLWVLALLTSAYQGIPATLLLLVLIAARPRTVLRLLPGAAIVALPAAALYLWIFAQGAGVDSGQPKPELILSIGTATLATLTTWTTRLDVVGHSVGAPLAFTTFWLLLFSPVLLWGQKGWRALALLAVAALLICFGKDFRVVEGGASLPSFIAPLVEYRGIDTFRFPIRFAWLFTLCAGLVGAAVLQALSRRLSPTLLLPVLALAVGDAVVGTGLPFRVTRSMAQIPSAYEHAPQGLAVLDLYGHSLDGTDNELEMWTRSLSCYYQAHHRRPVMELCVDTEIDSPREPMDAVLSNVLFEHSGDPSSSPLELARLDLVEQRVGSVVLHSDFYRPSDDAALRDGLQRMLGPAVVETQDGGERVVLYLVTDSTPQAQPGASERPPAPPPQDVQLAL